MNVEVFKGSKREIAERVAQMDGEVCEAIVFVERPSEATARQVEDIFAEMEPYTVNVGGADYSRDAIYSRMEGE
ncbi:MAG: hypothetical protein ABR915_17955 [Thermoguttaceae bacterium]